MPLALGLVLLSVPGTLWLVFFGGSEVVRDVLIEVSATAGLPANPVAVLGIYFLVCLITQLIVVPSGSIILIVAGYILGPFIAAGIFSLAQMLALYPVYRIAQFFIESEKPRRFRQTLDTWAASRFAGSLKQEGLAAGVVLRLTPVVPSAAACCLAALLRIPLTIFFASSVLVCWVRPLFFASVGGALKELNGLQNVIDGSATMNVWPLLMVFIASVLLLAARLWLQRQK